MVQGNSSIADIMYSCAAASLAAFLCPQDFLFVLIIRGALKANQTSLQLIALGIPTVIKGLCRGEQQR